jgi:hypothetical protein
MRSAAVLTVAAFAIALRACAEFGFQVGIVVLRIVAHQAAIDAACIAIHAWTIRFLVRWNPPATSCHAQFGIWPPQSSE